MAHQRRDVGPDFPFHKGNVVDMVNVVLEHHRMEVSVDGRNLGLGGAVDEPFRAEAKLDQVGDGHEAEVERRLVEAEGRRDEDAQRVDPHAEGEHVGDDGQQRVEIGGAGGVAAAEELHRRVDASAPPEASVEKVAEEICGKRERKQNERRPAVAIGIARRPPQT